MDVPVTRRLRWPIRLRLARALARLPEFRGQGGLVERLGALGGKTPHVQTVITTRQGFRIHCDTRQHVERRMFLFGGYEDAVLGTLTRLMHDRVITGDVAIDAGAHVGTYSLFLSRYFSSVHAFEPQINLCDRLKSNLDLNGIQNVVIHREALGDAAGTAHLWVPEGADGNTGMVGLDLHAGTDKTGEVRIVTADSMFGTIPGRVGFVKLDVEGYELNALKGMCDILHRDRPVVQFELTDWAQRRFGHTVQDVVDWLQTEDYVIFDAAPLCVLRDEPVSNGEYLAIPRQEVDRHSLRERAAT